jgi:hypothetical protein
MSLNIVAIQGSVRPGNYTATALAVVVDAVCPAIALENMVREEAGSSA